MQAACQPALVSWDCGVGDSRLSLTAQRRCELTGHISSSDPGVRWSSLVGAVCTLGLNPKTGKPQAFRWASGKPTQLCPDAAHCPYFMGQKANLCLTRSHCLCLPVPFTTQRSSRGQLVPSWPGHAGMWAAPRGLQGSAGRMPSVPWAALWRLWMIFGSYRGYLYFNQTSEWNRIQWSKPLVLGTEWQWWRKRPLSIHFDLKDVTHQPKDAKKSCCLPGACHYMKLFHWHSGSKKVFLISFILGAWLWWSTGI